MHGSQQSPAENQHGRSYYVGLGLMGLLYIAAGTNHFVHPATYTAIMPPYIPWPSAMVSITGAAEILGGASILAPRHYVFPATRIRIRAAAAWGLVALLIAISPVHINMCLHPDRFPNIPTWAIWLRLPLQLPLIAWAWLYTKK